MTAGSCLYLAGPMRGFPRFNFDSFEDARRHLRSLGHQIICPAERDVEGGFDPSTLKGTEDLTTLDFDLHAALETSIRYVLQSDAVALLPGWTRSEGAKAEALIARLTGRPLYEYHRHRPNPLRLAPEFSISTRVEALAQ